MDHVMLYHQVKQATKTAIFLLYAGSGRASEVFLALKQEARPRSFETVAWKLPHKLPHRVPSNHWVMNLAN